MTEKLKLCPFCGGKMKVDYKLRPLRYAVIHISKFYWTDRCYGGTEYEYQSEEEAIKVWNRRVRAIKAWNRRASNDD